MSSNNKPTFTFQTFQKIVQEDFKDFHPLMKISKKINVAPANLILGLLVLFFIMIMNGILGDEIVYLLGFCYPFYKSSICLKNRSKKQIKFWLIYWIFFMGMNEFQKIFRIFLFFLPKSLYNIIITIFFMALYHPRSPLITKIYQKIMKPHSSKLKEIEEKIRNSWKELVK